MQRLSILACAILTAFVVGHTACAQSLPGGSLFNPPPPPPLPSPNIAPPVIPQFGVTSPSNVQSTPQPSFSDRITTCLDQGAAAGLGPSDNEVNSRSCANQ
jgi:hypothetical protein